MKKLFLSIGILLLAAAAWALPDVIMPKEYSGTQQVTSKPTTVSSVNVTYVGATAGDYIQLMDSIGTSNTSSIRFTCVAATSSGTCLSPYSQSAAYFGTGVYYKESHGVFKTDIQSF